METVTVSSKGQVTIPSRLRKELKIVKGEKLLIFREGNSIKMIPMPRLSNLAGVEKEVFKKKKPSIEIESMRKEWTWNLKIESNKPKIILDTKPLIKLFALEEGWDAAQKNLISG